MACIPRLSHHILPLSIDPLTRIPFRAYQARPKAQTLPRSPQTPPLPSLITKRHLRSSPKSRAGWFSGLVQTKPVVPDLTKAGDPVLHEPAQEVRPDEILSERVQKIIDDMINVMRKAPGVGLAAPQIGVSLRVWLYTMLQRLYIVLHRLYIMLPRLYSMLPGLCLVL